MRWRRARGPMAHRCAPGFFPDVLGADERVDAICFNDVLEHIPDVRLALTACYRHLSPGGLLSINIPNSRGLVYRVALLARRLAMRGLFDRLWQVGLPSPHLWYFDEAGISALCAAAGMKPVFAGRLPSLTRRGLWERAHEDRRPSAVGNHCGGRSRRLDCRSGPEQSVRQRHHARHRA